MAEKTPQEMLASMLTKAAVSEAAWQNQSYRKAQKSIAKAKRAMAREISLESIEEDVAFAVRKRIALAKATAAVCADPKVDALLNPKRKAARTPNKKAAKKAKASKAAAEPVAEAVEQSALPNG